MGDGSSKRSSRRSRKKRSRRSESDDRSDDGDSSISASSSLSDSESEDSRRSRKSSRRKERSSRHQSSRKKREKEDRREYEREKREKRRRKRRSRRSESEESSSAGEDSKPEAALRRILEEFPGAGGDLRQLLQMIDDGQAVDVRGISDKTMVKLLKKLFFSLNLKQKDNGLFLLAPNRPPSLDIIGSLLPVKIKSGSIPTGEPETLDKESTLKKDEADSDSLQERHVNSASVTQPKRIIGPAMPSAEMLAAAAALTEAATAMRDAEIDDLEEVLIGPPPPAVVSEAESANEAERFEEVTRIIGSDPDKPYDVLGVNWKMSSDNIKKKYWKLSLMVHPDKCSHPQAHQAFVVLNKCFKLLQDTEKRKELDEKIKLKEEQEQFKIELRSLREAAQWRKLQGISMEGDDILLAEVDEEANEPQKRDEWMTTLPPERKHGVPMQSTKAFSRAGKEGRGDTSMWTDNPLEKAQKAKQSYLEAYSKMEAVTAATTANPTDSESKMRDLVDKYNKAKRPISLLEKHKEESRQSSKEKAKRKEKSEKEEEWVGQHPWKPWDREKDLSAGRQKVNLDPKNMNEGLSSRFSSGSVQRNFL